jgi:hypothetical protein
MSQRIFMRIEEDLQVGTMGDEGGGGLTMFESTFASWVVLM